MLFWTILGFHPRKGEVGRKRETDQHLKIDQLRENEGENHRRNEHERDEKPAINPEIGQRLKNFDGCGAVHRVAS